MRATQRRQANDDAEVLFRRVFDDYYQAVVVFFARRGLSREDSRDLAQETFLRVYKGIASFRREARPRTWVIRVAMNVWLNELRFRRAAKRRATETEVEGEVDLDLAALRSTAGAAGRRLRDPLEEALATEREDLLRVELLALPPRMRQCMMLRLHGGLKYGEIAAVLQVSIDTVKAQLHQAKTRLRRKLADRADDVES